VERCRGRVIGTGKAFLSVSVTRVRSDVSRRPYRSIDAPASDTRGSVGGPALRLAVIGEEAAAEMWVARGAHISPG
jgi:hypothetical protein